MILESQHHNQYFSESNLSYPAIGQPVIARLLLSVLVVVGCCLFSAFVGYSGASVFLYVFLKTQYAVIYLLVTPITVIGFASAIYLGLKQSIFLVLSSSAIVIFVSWLLDRLDFIKLSQSFLYDFVGNLVIQLVICSISFFVFRFIYALINVLYNYPSRVKKITYLFVGVTSTLAALSSLSGFQSREVIGVLTGFNYEVAKITSITGGWYLALP